VVFACKIRNWGLWSIVRNGIDKKSPTEPATHPIHPIWHHRMASGINIYSFLCRYPKYVYPKYVFWISEIVILDIQNNEEQVFYFGYPKFVFWISRIGISDIQKKRLFWISEIMFLDIWNSYFGYLKFFFWISKNFHYYRYPKIRSQISEILFRISEKMNKC